jgi:monoamine oxidase
LSAITRKIDPRSNEPVSRFLASIPGPTDRTKRLLNDYVEGFFAADPDRITTRSLAQEESQQTFRPAGGYRGLVDWFAKDVAARGVEIRTSAAAERLQWKSGRVEVETPSGRFRAARAILTLPIGAWATLAIDPVLPDKLQSAARLPVGDVVRLVLRFRTRFWPIENAFVHAPGEFFPTWWCRAANATWTGWLGGPRAARVYRLPLQELKRRAMDCLSRFFRLPSVDLEQRLESAHYHDWSGDPFARGAYSYLAADALDAPRRIAEPVASTLFFAGEATAAPGDEGTVHGALASGHRAAAELMSA